MHQTWQKKRIKALTNFADVLNTCYRIVWTHSLPTNFSGDYYSMIPADFSSDMILEGGGRYKKDMLLDFKKAKGHVLDKNILKHANRLYDATTYLESCPLRMQKQFKRITGYTATGIKGKIERRFFQSDVQKIKDTPYYE